MDEPKYTSPEEALRISEQWFRRPDEGTQEMLKLMSRFESHRGPRLSPRAVWRRAMRLVLHDTSLRYKRSGSVDMRDIPGKVYVIHDPEAPECDYAVGSSELAVKLTRLEVERGLMYDVIPVDLLTDDEARARIGELEKEIAEDAEP